MGSTWNPFGFQLHKIFCFFTLIFLFQFHECRAINLEGRALLDFRANVDTDPYGIFTDWNADDSDPCMWTGIHCEDGKVNILDLSGLLLGGTLSPELGKLTHLKSLILYKNHLSGVIPKEFGELTRLELLDLSSNNLSGMIPAEIGSMLSLKRLILCNNKFHGSIPLELQNLSLLAEIHFDRNLTFAVDSGIRCSHRKFRHCSIWQKDLKQLEEDSLIIQILRKFQQYVDELPWFFRKSALDDCGERYCEILPTESNMVQNTQQLVEFVRRRLLQDPSNLPAMPATGGLPPEPTSPIPPTRSSGSFPAIPKVKPKSSSPDPPVNQTSQSAHPTANNKGDKKWVLNGMLVGGVFLLVLAAFILFFASRRRGVKNIQPWNTGLSGQLKKAFITGVAKLNSSEVEVACEDFSNIIDIVGHMTIYKGTLSTGVEIAVASSNVKTYRDWTRRSEMIFRRKIDSFSRVNHKNFVNLLGYCEENKPFSRMMVFKYASSGTLFEHLHVQELEHLDWNARMRVIMGIAYCLQYMHELDPPVSVDLLSSKGILLTEDYAAKIADLAFWTELGPRSKNSGEDSVSESPLTANAESNVYGYGILLLETISGRLPSYDKDGPFLKWASEYLNDRHNLHKLIDPTLESFKQSELDVICEVIKDCIHQDPKQRPTMGDVLSKLREVIAISPDQAGPRMSPLWWAELEILSQKAS